MNKQYDAIIIGAGIIGAAIAFELSKKGRYPSILAELAESFGMMLVKVEAREFERIRNPFPILTSLQFPSTSR